MSRGGAACAIACGRIQRRLSPCRRTRPPPLAAGPRGHRRTEGPSSGTPPALRHQSARARSRELHNKEGRVAGQNRSFSSVWQRLYPSSRRAQGAPLSGPSSPAPSVAEKGVSRPTDCGLSMLAPPCRRRCNECADACERYSSSTRPTRGHTPRAQRQRGSRMAPAHRQNTFAFPRVQQVASDSSPSRWQPPLPCGISGPSPASARAPRPLRQQGPAPPPLCPSGTPAEQGEQR